MKAPSCERYLRLGAEPVSVRQLAHKGFEFFDLCPDFEDSLPDPLPQLDTIQCQVAVAKPKDLFAVTP
jgi:hypothetical protein